jgi:hypothetical protein
VDYVKAKENVKTIINYRNINLECKKSKVEAIPVTGRGGQ